MNDNGLPEFIDTVILSLRFFIVVSAIAVAISAIA
jgi:hypothetical protein